MLRETVAAVPDTTTRIPTNLITGFLGAGKTSAIQSLLQYRPPHERWAIVVNEYGMVSLDHILLNPTDDNDDDAGVHVDELAGGCFCCTLSMALPFTLARLIRKARPHRILLEPTGSGHPAAVIDLLRTGRLSELLELRTTICLLDPRDYENPRITNKEVFRDQIQMADVVAINFTDKCGRDQLNRCRQFVEDQDPPKLLIAETSMGQLQPGWLDLDGIVVRRPQFADAHGHHHIGENHNSDTKPTTVAALADIVSEQDSENSEPRGLTSLPVIPSSPDIMQPTHPLPQTPLPGTPVRFMNSGLGQHACGWIFSRDDVFDRHDLLDLLGRIQPLLRLKGVFHCSDDWWSIQRRGADTRLERSAYRRDSRLEVIVEGESADWDHLESQLKLQLKPAD